MEKKTYTNASYTKFKTKDKKQNNIQTIDDDRIP